jgi:hypothetical protein
LELPWYVLFTLAITATTTDDAICSIYYLTSGSWNKSDSCEPY